MTGPNRTAPSRNGVGTGLPREPGRWWIGALHRYVWNETRAETMLQDKLEEVVAGRLSPYGLAEEILAGLKDGAQV